MPPNGKAGKSSTQIRAGDGRGYVIVASARRVFLFPTFRKVEHGFSKEIINLSSVWVSFFLRFHDCGRRVEFGLV